MGNEAACDELRKYFSWATQVLAFFFFSAGKLLYIQRGALVNCEKIISQLGKNIFPVWQILFPSYVALFGQLLHEYTV